MEVIFLVIGVYIYLFAIGVIRFSDEEKQQRATAIREQNGRWLRLLGLALAAINLVNIFYHLREMFF